MKHSRYVVTTLLYVLSVLPIRTEAVTDQPLPPLAANLSQTAVSGLSSGAFMAGQFAVAYSSLVVGAALLAGGPYYCAGEPGTGMFTPYLLNATTTCMNPDKAGVAPPDAAQLWERTQDFARDGLIDDVANLQRQAIYLFSGTNDRVVTTDVVDQTKAYFTFASVARLRYRDNLPAGHGFVTDNEGNECAVTAPPYVNDCDVEVANEMMAFLYADLKPPAAQASGTILRFNQRPYINGRSGMADDGYLYVPASCTQRSCRVHVAFHGCRQDAESVGDFFYGRTGYNAIADSNDIIVLYPQVQPSGFFPYNPQGCWDFWGYSSPDPFLPDYFTRDGVQMRAVRAMLAQLAQPRTAG